MADAPRPPLFTRQFVLLWMVTFLTFFAAFQLFPTMPLRLRALGASLATSGHFLASFTAGSALGALFTGSLGDRVGQRRMMIAASLGFTLFLGSYPLLQHPGLVVALAFPHGVVWSGLLTAAMAELGHILPPERRADGMSLYGLASPGGVIFGPLAGVALYQALGFAPLTGILSGLFLLLTPLCLALPQDRVRHEATPLFRLPEKIILGPAMVLFTSALGYGVLGSYTVQEGQALGFGNWRGLPLDAAFLSLMAVGMVAMRLLMTRIGFGARPVRLLPAMMGAASLGLILLAALPGGLWRHAVSALLYGGGYSMMHTLVSTYVLNVTHPERRGAAFGATLFSFDAGIGLGSLGIGYVIGTCGFRSGWALAALANLAALPLSLHLNRLDAKRHADA